MTSRHVVFGFLPLLVYVFPPQPQVGGVKCCPPFSDNRLIFFQPKALLVDRAKHKSWKSVKDSSLKKVRLIPTSTEDKACQFKPQSRPPLVRSVTVGTNSKEALSPGTGLTKTPPRQYQVELFRAVTENERNSLVYLPTGLGKTVVAAMVLQRLLGLNPGRQAYFLVDSNALAMQQVGLRKFCVAFEDSFVACVYFSLFFFFFGSVVR